MTHERSDVSKANTQRAEEVAQRIWNHISGDKCPERTECIEVITNALQRFAEEAHHDCTWTHKNHKCKVCTEVARNAALDEAAGIAETVWDHVPSDEEFEPSSHLTQIEIASRIRALKSEAK